MRRNLWLKLMINQEKKRKFRVREKKIKLSQKLRKKLEL